MSKTFGGENEKMIKVKFIKPCLIFIESLDNYQKQKFQKTLTDIFSFIAQN